MRKALNENPRVQLAVLGVGAVLLAVVFLTSMSGGDSGTEPVGDTADPAAVDAGAASTPAPAPTPATPAPAPSTGTPAPAPQAVAPEAGGIDSLQPSKGLPEDVLVAYARNKAIALLVIDPKATTDRQVEDFVKRVGSRDDVEVFVVKARNIAKYSRITQGVAVSRTPALVVIRPRNKSEQVRTATVSYGFRGGRSIEVALEDALYTGGSRTTAP